MNSEELSINYQDYEAIAALKHGTLEDWAFDDAASSSDLFLDVLISAMVAQNALDAMKNDLMG